MELVARKPLFRQSPAQFSVGGARLAASVVTETLTKEKAGGVERWASSLLTAEVPPQREVERLAGDGGGTSKGPILSWWPLIEEEVEEEEEKEVGEDLPQSCGEEEDLPQSCGEEEEDLPQSCGKEDRVSAGPRWAGAGTRRGSCSERRGAGGWSWGLGRCFPHNAIGACWIWSTS